MAGQLQNYINEDLKFWLDKERNKDITGKYSNLSDASLYWALSNDVPTSLRSKNLDIFTDYQEKQQESATEDLGIFAQYLDRYSEFLPDWRVTHEGYNRSLTGSVYEIQTGKKKYDHDTENMGLLEDVGSTILSFMMPLDFMLFGGGKWVGSKVQRKMYNKMLSRAEQKAGTRLANIPIRKQIAAASTGGAFPLAMYEGAAGVMHEMIDINKGKKDGEKYTGAEIRKIIGAGALGTVRGGILGSITSGTSAGLLGRRAKFESKFDNPTFWEKTKRLPWYDNAAWGATSKIGQVAVEAGLFTLGGRTFDNIVNLTKGKDTHWGGLLEEFLSTSALFAGLKFKHGVFKRTNETVEDARLWLQEKAQDPEWIKKFSNVLDDYKSRFEGEAISTIEAADASIKELQKEIEESNLRPKELIGNLKNMSDKLHKIVAALNKPKEKFAKDHQEAFEDLHQMEDRIAVAIEDFKEIKESLDPVKNRTDILRIEEITNKLQELKEKHSHIAQTNRDYISKHRNPEKERQNLAVQLKSKFTILEGSGKNAHIDRAGQEIPLYIKGKLNKDVKLKEIQNKIKELEKAEGKRNKGSSSVEKKIKDLDEHLEGKDLGDTRLTGDIIERRKELAGQSDSPEGQKVDYIEDIGRDSSGKKTITMKPSKELDTAEKRSLYERSSKYLKNIIQNVFPEAVGTTGSEGVSRGTGSFVDVGGLINQVKQMNKFITFLADRGKDFNTMELKDLRAYLSENTGHRWAISNLLKEINLLHGKKLEDYFKADVIRYILDPARQLQSLAVKIKTEAEKELLKGVKLKSLAIVRNIKGIAEKVTVTRERLKSGIYKQVPLSKELSKIFGRLYDKVLKFKDNLAATSRSIFNAEDGHTIYHSDIASIIESFLPKKGRGGREFRSLFPAWASQKDKASKIKKPGRGNEWVKRKNVKYKDVAEIFGLTHKKTEAGKKYLQETYDISKEQAESLLEIVKNEFDKDVRDYLAGKQSKDWAKLMGEGVESKSKYTLVEVLDVLKDVTKEKSSKVYEIESILATKTKPFSRKYSKDTVEGLLRYMVEVPSDYMELATPDPKSRKIIEEGKEISLSPREVIKRNIEGKARKKLDETSAEWRATESRLEKEGAFKDVGPAQRIKLIKEAMMDKVSTEKSIKEWEKDDPDRQEKITLNSENRLYENRLKREGYTEEQIGDLRLRAFGKTTYKVNPNFTADMFKFYRDILKKEIEFEDSPNKIKKVLENSFFPEESANKIAKILGQKDGDYTKLKGAERQRFVDFVEDFDPFRINDYMSAVDLKFTEKDILFEIKDGFAGKMQKASFVTHVLIKNIALKSKGKFKKAAELYQQFTSDFMVWHDGLWGTSKLEYNNYLKKVKKLGKGAGTNFGYWANPYMMEHVIKMMRNKNVPEAKRLLYRQVYEKNKTWYNNSKKKNKPEYIIIRDIKASMDRIWGQFESSVKNANENIEGTTKYKEIMDRLKKMKVDYYIPQILTQRGREHILSSKEFKDEVNDLVTKKIESKAVSKANEKIYKKKPALKKQKMKDKLDDKQWLAYYNNEIKRIQGNASEMKKIRGEASNKVMSSRENGKSYIESSNFMERGEPVDMFMFVKDKKGNNKIIETYESSIFKIMSPYIITSSRFITSMRMAPEYMSKKFYAGDKTGRRGKGVRDALNLIDMFEGMDGPTFRYLDNVRNEMMGSSKSETNAVLQSVGTISANAGLSAFAEPGIKNFVLAQAQLLATHDVGLYASTFLKLFGSRLSSNKKYWNEARKRAEVRGAIGTVKREFGEKFKWAQETVYKYNWMNMTEAFNRMVSIETGRMEYMDIIERLVDPNSSKKERDIAEDWLKNLVRFTEKDVVEIKSGKVFENTPEAMERFDFLLSKVETYVHKATQGGTNILDVPAWMAGKYKHFFLFQRIAASVTNNIIQSVMKPLVKYKNPVPLLKYVAGSVAGGALLQMVKQIVYGKASPVESEDLINEMFFYMWRAEMLGMFGSLADIVPPSVTGVTWNPYNDIYSSNDILRQFSPVIIRNMVSLGDAVAQFSLGYKSLPKAINTLGKEVIVGYSQWDKFKKTRVKEKGNNFITLQDAYEYNRQYRKDIGTSRGGWKGGFGGSGRTAYYQDLKDALYFGDEEKVAQAYWSAYDMIVLELMDQDRGSTEFSRDIDAKKAIKSSLSHMNPLGISDDVKGRSSSKREAYINWLKKKDREQRLKGKMYKTVMKAEKIYYYNKNRIKQIAGLDKYKHRYSIYPDK